jgi:fatty-acyl-CoA synthase
MLDRGGLVWLGFAGEIWASGPMIFKGYLNKPAETAEAFGEINGKRYFRTGDLGRVLENGILKVRKPGAHRVCNASSWALR